MSITKITEEQSRFLVTMSTNINDGGDNWFYIPTWFKRVGVNAFELYRFEELPKQVLMAWLHYQMEMKPIKKPDFIPYGEEWKKEMLKLPKAELIDIASKIGQELEKFKAHHTGLWATDKPDSIPLNVRHLFFEIKP